MRTLSAAALLCAALLPAIASAGETVIGCKISGPGLKDYDYKTVVEGEFKLNVDELVIKPKTDGGGCIVVGRKSRTFGAKNGTRLEFAAYKCSSDKPYFSAKVLIAGLTVVNHLKPGHSRFVFNEDGGEGPSIMKDPSGALPPGPPLVLPEGTFRFLYVDCTVR